MENSGFPDHWNPLLYRNQHSAYALCAACQRDCRVTNVIPFFGPFIGAIPSGILVLLVSPVQCAVLLLWILILQQIDGNIIGPKILGNSTGLASFWVLFSILIFGGLFRLRGMIIAVPGFAVIYDLVKKAVNYSLRRKRLSVNTEDYRRLDYIDEEKKTYVSRENE